MIIEKDIKVYCVTANSFPEGILTAHRTLHSKIPFSKKEDILVYPDRETEILRLCIKQQRNKLKMTLKWMISLIHLLLKRVHTNA